MRPSHLLCIAVAIFIFGGNQADAQTEVPYGPAPQSLTWRQPPMVALTVEPHGVITLGSRLTEIDVWARNRTYRLRQRRDKWGATFTLAHKRHPVAYFDDENRDLYNNSRKKIIVYGWAS